MAHRNDDEYECACVGMVTLMDRMTFWWTITMCLLGVAVLAALLWRIG